MLVTLALNVIIQRSVHKLQHPVPSLLLQVTLSPGVGAVVGIGVGLPATYVGAFVGIGVGLPGRYDGFLVGSGVGDPTAYVGIQVGTGTTVGTGVGAPATYVGAIDGADVGQLLVVGNAELPIFLVIVLSQ